MIFEYGDHVLDYDRNVLQPLFDYLVDRQEFRFHILKIQLYRLIENANLFYLLFNTLDQLANLVALCFL